MNQNTKIVITGVLGFIGGHTAKAVKKAGYHVIGIDRAWTMKEGAVICDELVINDLTNIVKTTCEWMK